MNHVHDIEDFYCTDDDVWECDRALVMFRDRELCPDLIGKPITFYKVPSGPGNRGVGIFAPREVPSDGVPILTALPHRPARRYTGAPMYPPFTR